MRRGWLTFQHWRSEGLASHCLRRFTLRAQSSFFQPQMMVAERYFYDPVQNRYTVDRYLDDLETRYGGIDAVLVWPGLDRSGGVGFRCAQLAE